MHAYLEAAGSPDSFAAARFICLSDFPLFDSAGGREEGGEERGEEKEI